MWIGYSLSGQKLPWDRKAHEDDGGQCNHKVWNPPAVLDEAKFYTRITLLTSAHDSAVGKANQISVRVDLTKARSYKACQEWQEV